MEFFNKIHCKYTGVKGFVGLHEYALRYQYMITDKTKYKLNVLAFWRKYGLEPTMEAYKIKRSTLFLWKQKLRQGQGKAESLNEQSRKPKSQRKRFVRQETKEYIIQQRKEHLCLGKDKLCYLLRQEQIDCVSASTIGRTINDLKQKNLISTNKRLSFYAKTDSFKEKTKVKTKKIRRNKYQPKKQGDLVQVDTIVKFINGLKRYIVTAIDLDSDFAFAFAYTGHSSTNTKDFLLKLEQVAPFQIQRIQTDNGSEFEYHFRECLKEKKIIHFHNYPRCPKMNAHVERFNRTLQEEFLNSNLQTLAYDLNAFNYKLVDWLLWYNTKRPHWSLGLKSPLAFLVSNLIPEKSNMLWTSTLS